MYVKFHDSNSISSNVSLPESNVSILPHSLIKIEMESEDYFKYKIINYFNILFGTICNYYHYILGKCITR